MLKCIKTIILVLLVIVSKGAFSFNDAAFTDSISGFVRVQMEKDHTPGVVVLVSSPKIGVKRLAFGQAELGPHEQKMTDDLNFRVASISKTFLAVMILKMIEQGKIERFAGIAQYLPKDIDRSQIPNLELITVQDLLRMSSGIPEYYDLDVDEYLAAYPYKQWQPRDALRFSTDLQSKLCQVRAINTRTLIMFYCS